MSSHLHRLILSLGLALGLALVCVPLTVVLGDEAAERRQKAQDDRAASSLPPGAISQFGITQRARTHWISVTFLPDGQTVATTGPGADLIFRDAGTGKEIRRLKGHRSVAFAPGGKILASSEAPKGDVIRILDIETGKEIAQVPRTDDKWRLWRGRDLCFCFSPDGRYLAVGGGVRADDPTPLRFWEVATGKEVVRDVPLRTMLDSLAFSPDGKLIATVSEAPGAPIRLWDLTTGKERHQFPTRDRFQHFRPGSMTFSPDGNSLVAADEGRLQCWDVHTGKASWRIPAGRLDIQCSAFSPNGQTLAVGTGKGTVCLLEAATGGERCRFNGHSDTVWSVAFSPDGLMLASAALDASFLVWDVTGRIQGAGQKVKPFGAKELDAARADLAGKDAAKAWQAILTLAARPDQAVPLLKERLPANPPLDPKRLARLFADLDSDDFNSREKACKDLEALGSAVVPALRKLAASTPSVEVRERVGKVLDRIPNDELLCGRALEVLEYAATPEARKLLEAEAKGAAESTLTRGAKAALDRLAKRRPAKP